MNAPLRSANTLENTKEEILSDTGPLLHMGPGGGIIGNGATSASFQPKRPVIPPSLLRARSSSSPESQDFTFVEELLVHEAAVREALSALELKFLITNDVSKLISAGQVIFRKPSFTRRNLSIELISSISKPDNNAPVVRWLESQLDILFPQNHEPEKTILSKKLDLTQNPLGSYPYIFALNLRLRNKNGEVLGNLTLFSETKFEQRQIALSNRLASTYAHALAAFGRPPGRWSWVVNRTTGLLGMLILAASMFIPVPMTVLAPVTIAAEDSLVVAAPLQGVIDKIHVSPDTAVKKGDLLFSYVKTDLKARFEVAQRNLSVATAKMDRSSREAFGNGAGRRDLGVNRAEQKIAISELEYARQNLSKTDVIAGKSGVALFASVEEWVGRPVATGEQVMQIADPGRTRFEIDLAVNDSIILESGAGVLVFLDAAPLSPVEARIVRKSYRAELTETDVLAFEILAIAVSEKPTNTTKLRIGLRGTAQLWGDTVSLGFFLFRKPLSAMRQYFGI